MGTASPLDRPDDDPRFTLGLALDVARALERAGYPPVTCGGDVVALQSALFGFLYRRSEPALVLPMGRPPGRAGRHPSGPPGGGATRWTGGPGRGCLGSSATGRA
jgi:hypothetical protein